MRQLLVAVLLPIAVPGCASRPSVDDGSPAVSAAPVIRSFPANGVKRLILRASAATQAEINYIPGAAEIEVSGRPSGGAKGYHPSDPNWRETPAAEWGLDFEGKQYGDVLVVSTKYEIHYIHHHYVFTELQIRVPAGVEVMREARHLSGEGAAELDPPKK